MKRVEVVMVDNRDVRTTWLWIDKDTYIEVDPFDLVENSIENLPDQERETYMTAFKQFKDL